MSSFAHHRFVRHFGWLLLVALSLFGTTPAVAQPKKDTGTSNLLRIAEKLFLEGMRLAQQRRFEDALAKFRASYRIVPSAKEPKNERIRGTLHLLIGRTYHRMKRWTLARDHYRLYLGMMQQDRRRPKVLAWLKEIRPNLMATLRLSSTPSGRCVVTFPGGKWEGTPPASIKVESGKVSIRCSAEMYKAKSMHIAIAPKESKDALFELEKLPAPPPPPQDLRWVGAVIGGLGLAALASGGVLGGLALADQDNALSAAQNAQNGDDTFNAWRTHREGEQKAFVANIMFISGGVLAVTGVILYFVLIPRPPAFKSNKSGQGNGKSRIRLRQDSTRNEFSSFVLFDSASPSAP